VPARLLTLLAALASAGPGPAAAAEGGSLRVAAAANLQVALEEIVAAFQAHRPGADVRASYGASGAFVAQIRNGAPFDLFLAADAAFPARLAEAGLADGAPFPYALGRLVLWVPASSPLDLGRDGLRALLDPSVRRVAIANPALAPYGAAAEEALAAAGLLEAVRGKLVMGQSAAQAALFAESGNAQAALLPLSLAAVPPLSREGRFRELPAGSHRPIEQAGVILKASRSPGLARAFAGFLLGPEGRALLLRGGYALPPTR